MVWSEESGVEGLLFLIRSMNSSMTCLLVKGYWGGVVVVDVSSGNTQASRIVTAIDIGVEKSESKGWIYVSKGLGIFRVNLEAV